jgi:hypothetical protein
MKSHEVVHFRGQYYTQAGRPLNPAQASEIPSVGSVIAMELENQRRPTDTFPTYLGCNLDTSGCGALSTGFLAPRHSVLDLNLKSGAGAAPSSAEAMAVLAERYRLLSELDAVMAPGRTGRDRNFGGFRDFQMGSAIAPDARPLRCAGAAAISKQGAARGGDFQLAMDAADDLRARAAW